MGKPEVWILILFCIFSKFDSGLSSGRLYVRFLSYNNEGNRDYHGNCCDSHEDLRVTCKTFCDLTFQVSIFSIDGKNITDRKLTRDPIGDSNYFLFPDNQWTGVENPMIFFFKNRPGMVRVLVRVYDQDDVTEGSRLQLIDIFSSDITDASLSNNTYTELKGQRPGKKSVMGLLFRFDCAGVYPVRHCGTSCVSTSNTDCITMTNNIPMSSDSTVLSTEASSTTATSISSFVQTTDISTSASTVNVASSKNGRSSINVFSKRMNRFTTKNNPSSATSSSAVFSRALLKTTTTSATSTSSSVQTTDISTTASTANIESSKNGRSSLKVFSKRMNRFTTMTNSSSETSSSAISSRALLKTTIKRTIFTTIKSNTTSTPEVTSSPILRNRTKQTPVLVDTVSKEKKTTLDPPSVSTRKSHPFVSHKIEDWDIVLGCVLGGVTLLTIVGFLVFYNRQKKLLMRNELYSVTPEIMSNLEVNGITGRSDIPFQAHSTST